MTDDPPTGEDDAALRPAMPAIYTIRHDEGGWRILHGDDASDLFASREAATAAASASAEADGRNGRVAVVRLQEEKGRLRILGIFGRGADPLPLLR